MFLTKKKSCWSCFLNGASDKGKNYPNFPKQKVLAIFDTVLSTSFFLPEFYLQNKPELSKIFLQDPPKQILPIESSWTLTQWSQRLCKFYTKRDLNQKHPEGPNSAKMLVGFCVIALLEISFPIPNKFFGKLQILLMEENPANHL